MSSGTFGALAGNKRESIVKSAFENEKVPKLVDLSIPREIIREEE